MPLAAPQRQRCYGLTLSLPFAVPHWSAAGACAPVDVEVVFGPVPELDAAARAVAPRAFPGIQRFVLSWPGQLAARVEEGRRIVLDPEPGTGPAHWSFYLQDILPCIALLQRRELVLHGSAFRRADGAAVAICAASGTGKSSLAAALARRGLALVADDVLRVDAVDTRPRLHAGPPRLKLHPGSAAALGWDPATLPRCHPEDDKRSVAVAGIAPDERPPLSTVVLLERGERVALDEVDAQDALAQLLRHTHAAWAVPQLDPVRHLAQVTALVGQVRVLRLRIPTPPDGLSEAAALIAPHP